MHGTCYCTRKDVIISKTLVHHAGLFFGSELNPSWILFKIALFYETLQPSILQLNAQKPNSQGLQGKSRTTKPQQVQTNGIQSLNIY